MCVYMFNISFKGDYGIMRSEDAKVVVCAGGSGD